MAEAAYELGSSWLVVDTGPWIIGKKVLLPAGTIEQVDPEERKLYVDRTREEIKSAPEHDPSGYAEQEYRLAIADYYANFWTRSGRSRSLRAHRSLGSSAIPVATPHGSAGNGRSTTGSAETTRPRPLRAVARRHPDAIT